MEYILLNLTTCHPLRYHMYTFAKIIWLHSQLLYMYFFRPTVIWRLMVVDGLFFSGEKMVLLISTSTGLIMFMIHAEIYY